MAKARRLTDEERLQIARERSEGVSAADLARRYAVSLKSVYNAVQHAQGRVAANGSRARVVGLRLSGPEVRGFDAMLSSRGIDQRSAALRRLVLAASGLLAPDDLMTEEMRRLSAALNRIGNNVNQIARRFNEARLRGEPLPWTGSGHSEIRALAALILDIADQVQELSRNRRKALDLEVGKALAPLLVEGRHAEI